MYGRRYDRQEPGRPIAARTLNRPIDGLEALEHARYAGGLKQQTGPGGTPLIYATPVDITGVLTKARSPAGGIAAKSGNTPGTATCTLYLWDGTSETLGSATVSVRNSYGTAVGANKDIWIVQRARTSGASTDWFVLTEAC